MVKPSYFLGRNVAAKWALLLLGNHDQWVKEAVIEITNICIYIYTYITVTSYNSYTIPFNILDWPVSLWHNLCDASIEPSDAWILLVTFHLSFVSWSTLLEINSWKFKGTPSNATPQENTTLGTGLIRGWWWLILPKNKAGYFLGGGMVAFGRWAP